MDSIAPLQTSPFMQKEISSYKQLPYSIEKFRKLGENQKPALDMPLHDASSDKHKRALDGKIASSAFKDAKYIQSEIARDSERKKLYEAALDFQALFINMMLKEQRKSVDRSSSLIPIGRAQEIFEDMLYDEYAKQMSRDKKFDLADQIYREMSRALPPIKESPVNLKEDQSESYRKYEKRIYDENLHTTNPSISSERLHSKNYWNP